MNDAQSASERFEALLEAARPPTGGLSLRDIAFEVAPLLPLLIELPEEERTSGDYESFEFRECFAVLTLLGRRLGLLDLTPTAAIQVVLLALRSVEGSRKGAEESTVGRFARTVVAATVEGFVLGREERVAQVAEARAAKPLEPLRIDETAYALIPSGVHEPAVLGECVDALGRAMLNANVELAIVDLTQLGEPNRERAAALFAADEITRMLGGVCFFTGVDSRWRAAAGDARIPLDALQIVPDLASAVATVRAMAARGTETGKPKWRVLLDRLGR